MYHELQSEQEIMEQSYRVAVPFLAEADREARHLGHAYIAPEHLFIALAANAAGSSRAFLDRNGLSPDTLRSAVRELVGVPG